MLTMAMSGSPIPDPEAFSDEPMSSTITRSDHVNTRSGRASIPCPGAPLAPTWKKDRPLRGCCGSDPTEIDFCARAPEYRRGVVLRGLEHLTDGWADAGFPPRRRPWLVLARQQIQLASMLLLDI